MIRQMILLYLSLSCRHRGDHGGISVLSAGQFLLPTSGLQEQIQTQDILVEKRKENKIPPSLSLKHIPDKDQWKFPGSPEFLAAALNFLS